MDPIQQIFAQIGVASAHGEGMGQFFLQGKQLGLQEQQLGMRREELDLRSRMELSEELRRRFAQEQLEKKVNDQLSNDAALSLLSKHIGTAVATGVADSPSSATPIWDIISTHPNLLGDKRYQDLMGEYTAAAKLQQAKKQFDAINSPEGIKERLGVLKAETDLERARLGQAGALARTQIMADTKIEAAEIMAGVQRENAKARAIRDRGGDMIYRSFLVQAAAIKDSIDLSDAQKQTAIQALEDEYLGRLRDASPVTPSVLPPLAPTTPAPAIPVAPAATTPLTNAVVPPATGNKRLIYRPK